MPINDKITGRAFIDSNILLYAIDRSEKQKRLQARNLLKSILRNKQAIISTQVVQEFYVIATTKLKVDPLTARRILEQLSGFEVISIDLAMIHEAIDCSILSRLSFWDSLIVITAQAAHCRILFSEDLNHDQVIRGIRIINPFKD